MTSKSYKREEVPPPPRRLTARSVIASILLGLDPPRLDTAALVAGATVLGVNPGTARVAISRMVSAGELEPTETGYRLAGHLLVRQARQDQSRLGTTLGWDGTWQTRVVPADPRSPRQRLELRRAMRALRYAELRDGVWLRPDNLPRGRLPEAEQLADHATVTTRGTIEAPEGFVDQLWDLDRWAALTTGLIADLAPYQQRLDEGDVTALADGFVLAATILRHLQADPLLPVELLAPSWPGPELRRAHERFEPQFRVVLRDWHRSQRTGAR